MRCLGRHYSLSLITASRSTRAPTISPSSTTRTLTMCRIIDNPRTNESGSSIPFGLTLSRKRPAPPNRTAIPKKPRWSGPKRNPSPARERNIESTTLPLTCTLARWRFRFAGLLSRVNAWPFRFITLLRVNASVFWQNGMEMRLSLITTSRSTRAPTISPSTTPRTLTMCRIIGSPRANGSGSSIPFGLTLSRKRPAPPNRTAIPEKPRRSGPKRNPPSLRIRACPKFMYFCRPFERLKQENALSR